MRSAFWSRRLHRQGAVLIALPLLVVVVSGILLQVKKEFDWIQPPTRRGASSTPEISFERILEVVRGVSVAEVSEWEDIDRLDVRPSRGMVKVRCGNGLEVQVDTMSGRVLQVARRRSDLIEAIHDGSFFFSGAKLWIFLPAALVLLLLWGTGIHLFFLPRRVRRRRERRRLEKG